MVIVDCVVIIVTALSLCHHWYWHWLTWPPEAWCSMRWSWGCWSGSCRSRTPPCSRCRSCVAPSAAEITLTIFPQQQRNVKTIQLYLLGSALLVFWTDDVNLIMLVSYRPLVHVNDVISVGNQESENIRVQLCWSCCLQTMFCAAHIGFVVFQ